MTPEEIKDLERRLESHIKGESIEHICRECGKKYYNVDDEPIICPWCNCGYMPANVPVNLVPQEQFDPEKYNIKSEHYTPGNHIWEEANGD